MGGFLRFWGILGGISEDFLENVGDFCGFLWGFFGYLGGLCGFLRIWGGFGGDFGANSPIFGSFSPPLKTAAMNPGSRLAAVDSAPPFLLTARLIGAQRPGRHKPRPLPGSGRGLLDAPPPTPTSAPGTSRPPGGGASPLGAELRAALREWPRPPRLLHKPRPLDLLRHLGGGVSGGETDVSSDQ